MIYSLKFVLETKNSQIQLNNLLSHEINDFEKVMRHKKIYIENDLQNVEIEFNDYGSKVVVVKITKTPKDIILLKLLKHYFLDSCDNSVDLSLNFDFNNFNLQFEDDTFFVNVKISKILNLFFNQLIELWDSELEEGNNRLVEVQEKLLQIASKDCLGNCYNCEYHKTTDNDYDEELQEIVNNGQDEKNACYTKAKQKYEEKQNKLLAIIEQIEKDKKELLSE